MIRSEKKMIDLTEEDILKEEIHDIGEGDITTLTGLVRAYPTCVVSLGMHKNSKGENVLVAIATMKTDDGVAQYQATMIQNESAKQRKPLPNEPAADNEFSEYIEQGLASTFATNIKEDQAEHGNGEYAAIFSNMNPKDRHNA